MPWAEVGEHVGLSAKQARYEGYKALEKLRILFAELGMDEEYLASIAHSRDNEAATQADILFAMVDNNDQ